MVKNIRSKSSSNHLHPYQDPMAVFRCPASSLEEGSTTVLSNTWVHMPLNPIAD